MPNNPYFDSMGHGGIGLINGWRCLSSITSKQAIAIFIFLQPSAGSPAKNFLLGVFGALKIWRPHIITVKHAYPEVLEGSDVFWVLDVAVARNITGGIATHVATAVTESVPYAHPFTCMRKQCVYTRVISRINYNQCGKSVNSGVPCQKSMTSQKRLSHS